MLFYISIFALNMLCAYIADKTYQRNKAACYVSLAMIVVLNSVVYGLRDFGVGVDSNLYVRSYFMDAQHVSSLKTLIEWGEDMDLGYLLLAKVSWLYSNDPQNLLFSSALFTWLFLIIGLYQMKKALNVQMWIYILFFNFAMGVHTLNYMRQFCAMGLLFLGCAYLFQGKWKYYLILQVIAYFFHSSSITFLIIPAFYFLSQMENIRRRNLLTIAGFVGIVFLIVTVWQLFSSFSDLGVLADRYEGRYGEGGTSAASGEFTKFNYSRSIIGLYSLYMLYQTWKRKAINSQVVYITFVVWLCLVILQNSYFALKNIDRVFIYVEMVAYVFLALVYQSRKIPLPFKLLGYAMFVYLCYRTIIAPLYGVLPYTSTILGI